MFKAWQVIIIGFGFGILGAYMGAMDAAEDISEILEAEYVCERKEGGDGQR